MSMQTVLFSFVSNQNESIFFTAAVPGSSCKEQYEKHK